VVSLGGRQVASCTTQAAEGQQIVSQSPDLLDTRRQLTRMLFIEGNHFCPSCEKSGSCRLQAMAYELKVLNFEYPQLWPDREMDASHPDVLLDRDRCILCGLCVRASHELDGKAVFELGGRGVSTRLMVNSPTGRLAESEIARNDKAVAICPVGALLPKRRAFAVPIGQRKYDLRTIAGRAKAH